MGIIIILVALIAALLTSLFLGVKVVPQGNKWVVQRLGKYNALLSPGLNLIIPFVDIISYKVSTKDIVLDIPSQEVITKDNAVILANAVAYINITHPEKAVYGVENFSVAIKTLVQTTLRSIIGEMKLDEALSSRDMIKTKLKEGISDEISDWGILLKTAEIQDISPSGTMQSAMEEQAAAERARRATVTRAEGERESQVLEADGRLEASRRDAEAQVVLAKASREAIENITEAIKDNELPIVYLLGEKYIGAMQDLSQSENSKTMILPADLPAAIKGMMGK